MLKARRIEGKLINFLFFLSAVFLFSCKSNQDVTRDKLIGSWDITEMNYKGKDYVETLLINAFTIEKDGTITVPDTIDSKFEDREITSRWTIKQIEKNKIKVIIDCKKNLTFQGIYDISFFKNYDKKLLGIEFKSDSTYIRAYKVLQNFDINGKGW